MENSTHECWICGRLFDAVDAPEICNNCMNNAHKHRPRSDNRAARREASDLFYDTWFEYIGEFE